MSASSSAASAPRVVVVTGAGSGIGAATASAFAELGDRVIGLDVAGTAPEGVELVTCDVTDRSAVVAAIDAAAVDGRIDVLANVAGIPQFGRLATITEEEWDRTVAVDLKGPFLTMQAAFPYLREARGCIVNVASVAGRLPNPYVAAYAAAKGGLVHLSRSLAMELGPEGIRVNCVCPGGVDTPLVTEVAKRYPDDLDPRLADRMHPLLKDAAFMPPAEVAASIVYLASPAAAYISGAVLALDGMQG